MNDVYCENWCFGLLRLLTSGFEVQLTLPAEPQWFYSEDDVVLITKSDGSLWRAYVGFMLKTLLLVND